MLTRHLVRARPLTQLHSFHNPTPLALRAQRRWLTQADIDDPNMNGGYINPPRVSRQLRDPYGDWWDKQERRNYGEPVHEDNDILGMFAPEQYNFYTSPQCFALLGCAVGAFLTAFGVVYLNYPDMPAVKRGYEGGLDRELGGKGALLARSEDGID